MRLKIVRNSPPRVSRYYSVHTHSRFSVNDALPDVSALVTKAHQLGYPALALTDHGNMAGTIELYLACRKAGIKPFPGSEIYLVNDRDDKKAKRYHLGMVAYTTQGYRNLVKISTDTHRNFHYKPMLDFCRPGSLPRAGLDRGHRADHRLLLRPGGADPDQRRLRRGQAGGGRPSPPGSTPTSSSRSTTSTETGMTEDEIAHDLLSHRRRARAARGPSPRTATTSEPGDRPLHDTLKRLVSFGPDVDDVVFPGDGFHLADEAWMRAHHPEFYERGLTAGLDHWPDYDLTIPEMERVRTTGSPSWWPMPGRTHRAPWTR